MNLASELESWMEMLIFCLQKVLTTEYMFEISHELNVIQIFIIGLVNQERQVDSWIFDQISMKFIRILISVFGLVNVSRNSM